MKAIVQSYRTGELSVIESPQPQLSEGCILVRNAWSVISAGTEKTKVDTARKSLIGKAMSRPDLVRQVIDKARRDGIASTWQTVSDRLDTSMPLGYSCAGEVLEVCGDVGGLKPGDRVACAGSSANHAELVAVPKLLAARVPAPVGLDHAAFATLGAIAMQGIRQADVRLGEKVAVIGMGLIGLLTAQMLRAAGCRVFGIDVSAAKLDLAAKTGCDCTALAGAPDLAAALLEFTGGYGVDTTIITAATASNQPIEQAAEITRNKGRVVVVGLTRMDVPREPFYMKELDLRLSRSYGPGRYDPAYEASGHDYPQAYVRFTEGRNIQCFLELLEKKLITIDPIITHRFPLDRASEAYDLIHGTARDFYLGILLQYSRKTEDIPRRVDLSPLPVQQDAMRLGVIGAGKYATTHLLPVLRGRPEIVLGGVLTGSGLSAVSAAAKLKFHSAESDPDQLIRSSDAVLIATRHNEHTPYAIKALEAGKPVFVEKPLSLNTTQLDSLIACATRLERGSVMVGFNRRFAPATAALLAHFQDTPGPRQIVMRINAGRLPKDHWLLDPLVGGGRLLGEGCHFIDLALLLAGSPIIRVSAAGNPHGAAGAERIEDFTLALQFANGSVAGITYTSAGDPRLPKEWIEMHGSGRSAWINDFRETTLMAGGKTRRIKSRGQDKGQSAMLDLWVSSLRAGKAPIAFSDIVNVHQACFAALTALRDGHDVPLTVAQ